MGQDESSLGATMDARRRELDLRWRDVADEAGLSEETLRIVRKGGRQRAIRTTDTEARIERALRWERGSIKAVREGGTATPLPGSPGSRHPYANPMAGAWAPTSPRKRRRYPEFVGENLAYQIIWDIPDELLSPTERKYTILQIELRRWVESQGWR